MIWFILGMIGFFIFIILLSRIYVSINLLYTDQAKQVSVTVSLFRIRLFKKNYPLQPESINLPRFEPEFDNYSSKLHSLLESVKLMQQTITIIFEKLKLHKLHWVTEGGTGDAASTGAAAGGIWSLKGMATGLIGNATRLECKPVIQVLPDYQKLFFRSTLDCMVSIQIAQAIHIVFKIIRLFISMKPEKAVSA